MAPKKKSVTSSERSYGTQVRREIKLIGRLIHPYMDISKRALKMMEQALSLLNKKLVDSCKRNFKPTVQNKRTMTADVARIALTSTIGGEMQQCALAEAHKCLFKYNTGVLAYKVRPKKVYKAKAKRVTPHFIRSVPPIAQMVSQDASVSNDAKQLVGDILKRMCNIFIEKSRQTAVADSDSLKPKDIVKAVDYCMAPNLARHAISEGARSTLLFTNGLERYKPEDFEKKRLAALKRKATRSTPKKKLRSAIKS